MTRGIAFLLYSPLVAVPEPLPDLRQICSPGADGTHPEDHLDELFLPGPAPLSRLAGGLLATGFASVPIGLVYSLIGHRMGYSHSQEVSRCIAQEISLEVPSQGARRATGEGSQMGGRNPSVFPRGRRLRSCYVCCEGKRSTCCHVSWDPRRPSRDLARGVPRRWPGGDEKTTAR